MTETRKILFTFILASLALFSMLIWAIQFQYENNADIKLADDPSFSSLNNSLFTTLSQVRDYGVSTKNSTDSENPFAEGGSLLLTTIFPALKLVFNIPIASFNIITGFMTETIGIPAIISNVFIGMLLILLVLALWFTIRTGDS